MAKYRVAVIGTVGKSVLIDDSLSSRVAKLETQIATVGGVTRHSALLGLQQGDDHPQYTMWQAPETIAAPWNFGVIPFIQGETLAEYIEDVVAGGSDPFIADSLSITWTYDDTGNHLQADVVDEYIEDLVGSMLINSASVLFDYGDSDGSIKAYVNTEWAPLWGQNHTWDDNAEVRMGTDADLRFYHNGTDSFIRNETGALWLSVPNSGTALRLFRTGGSPAISWYAADGTTRTGALQVQDAAAGGNTTFNNLNSGGHIQFATTGTGNVQITRDSTELQLGASQDLRMYHDGTNSIVRTDTGGLRLQFSTNNRMEVNTTGVGFNGATPIARPDYTITNPTTNRSIDVSAITHAQLAQVVGTMIQDFINYGLYQ